MPGFAGFSEKTYEELYNGQQRKKFEDPKKQSFMQMMLVPNSESLSDNQMPFRLVEAWEWLTDFDAALGKHCETLTQREKEICWKNYDRMRRTDPKNAIYASKFVTFLMPNKWKIRNSDRALVIQGLIQLMILIVSNVELKESSFQILQKTGIPVKDFPYDGVYKIIRQSDPGFGALLAHHKDQKSKMDYSFEATTNSFYTNMIDLYSRAIAASKPVALRVKSNPTLDPRIMIDYLNGVFPNIDSLVPVIPSFGPAQASGNDMVIDFSPEQFIESDVFPRALAVYLNDITNLSYIRPGKGYIAETDRNVSSIDLSSLFRKQMIGVRILFERDTNGVVGFTAAGAITSAPATGPKYSYAGFQSTGSKNVGSFGIQYSWIHHMDLYLKTLLKKTGPSEWAKYENVMNKYPLVGLAAAFGVRLEAMEKISKLIEKQEKTDDEDDFDMSKMDKTNKLAAMDFMNKRGRPTKTKGRR